MPPIPNPFHLLSGSYPGDWGDFLVSYEKGETTELADKVYGLIHDKKNHRRYDTNLPLSPSMANAMELMDMSLGNDDTALLDAVVSSYPDVLRERSVEEISPSAAIGLCALSSANLELPIRATWLELASFRLSIQCVDRLLSHDALPLQPAERRGWPAGLAMWLYAESKVWTSSLRMLQVLGLLHTHGADFNLPDPWGRLPLCLLSRSGPPAQAMSICRQLMDMGAQPSGPLDENGAIRNGRPYRNCPVLENIRQGNLAAVSCFLSKDAVQVVSARTDTGDTALHVMAIGCISSVEPSHNIVMLARELISKGCDPNAENEDGQTPLELAVGDDNLLEFGKEIHRRGGCLNRGTPHWPLLFTACACPEPSAGKRGSKPSIAWLKWLISKGCSPNDRVTGRSVVHYIMQTQPRISMPGPSRQKPCVITGILAEVIASGWRPLSSDSGSIEDMVMATNPGPSLDSEKGWARLECRERIAFLVDCAIQNGWLDGPHLPTPSAEFASMMGSRWSKHLLDLGTTRTAADDTDHRRF